jgi:hypothetical protein
MNIPPPVIGLWSPDSTRTIDGGIGSLNSISNITAPLEFAINIRAQITTSNAVMTTYTTTSFHFDVAIQTNHFAGVQHSSP